MSRLVLFGNGLSILPQGEDVESQVHLDKLNDVTITSVADGQILKYNSTLSKFVNVDIDTIISDELTVIDGGTY